MPQRHRPAVDIELLGRNAELLPDGDGGGGEGLLAGVLGTPLLIDAIAPGFTGDTRELTIRVVRILFPGMGLMVMSAWCLGVLNSHRRFFISYSVPVVWNVAMIVTLLVATIWFSSRTLVDADVYAVPLGRCDVDWHADRHVPAGPAAMQNKLIVISFVFERTLQSQFHFA
jgi:hypothetical protein